MNEDDNVDVADFKPDSPSYETSNEIFKRAIDTLGLDDKPGVNLTQQNLIELVSVAIDKLADRVDELENENERLEQKIDDLEYDINSIDLHNIGPN